LAAVGEVAAACSFGALVFRVPLASVLGQTQVQVFLQEQRSWPQAAFI
jgi:hypothetical protein